MLNARRVLASRRFYTDDIIIRNGGFNDPWFSDSKFTDYKYDGMRSHQQFPSYSELTEDFNRPTE